MNICEKALGGIVALPVTVSEHDGLWIAECDDIGLVTEADSFDELRDRVWEIAPELVELNGLDTPADDLRLHFRKRYQRWEST